MPAHRLPPRQPDRKTTAPYPIWFEIAVSYAEHTKDPDEPAICQFEMQATSADDSAIFWDTSRDMWATKMGLFNSSGCTTYHETLDEAVAHFRAEVEDALRALREML